MHLKRKEATKQLLKIVPFCLGQWARCSEQSYLSLPLSPGRRVCVCVYAPYVKTAEERMRHNYRPGWRVPSKNQSSARTTTSMQIMAELVCREHRNHRQGSVTHASHLPMTDRRRRRWQLANETVWKGLIEITYTLFNYVLRSEDRCWTDDDVRNTCPCREACGIVQLWTTTRTRTCNFYLW